MKTGICLTKELRKAVASIVATADPDKIILFGSRAGSNHHPDSDYDLLVLKLGVKNRRKLAQKIYLDFSDIGAPIDVIVNDPAEFERLKDDSYLIYDEIKKNGIVIYEKG